MRKIIQKMMLACFSFVLFFGMTISVNAMSKEEEELFSMLGIEYRLDDNGEFSEFVVSETTSRCSQEQMKALVKKYEKTQTIGKYSVNAWINENADEVSFSIFSEDEQPVFMANNTCTIYGNTDKTFHALYYKDASSQEPYIYSKGSMLFDEKGNNLYEEYVRNEQGEFVPHIKQDEKACYEYDSKGNVIEYTDFEQGIIYDSEGNPTRKIMDITTDSLYIKNVPYDVVDEIQALLEQSQGNVDEDAISAIINDSNMAKRMGMDITTYRERKAIYDAYAAQGCVSSEVKARIFDVDRNITWTNPELIPEGELPETISEKDIAEELVKLINEYRIENGRQPLESCDLLQQVADIRAEESTYVMDSTHSRPLAGDAGSFEVGENLARMNFSYDMTSYEIAKTLFEGWKKSTGHNENMLLDSYTQGAIGIKIVKGMIYASHDFAAGYEEVADDTIKKMIEVGAQVPGNIESATDYYEKVFGGYLPQGNTVGNEMTEVTAPGNDLSNMPNNEEDTINGGTMIYGDLQVLDENGNRFELPNGSKWVNAWTNFSTREIYDQNGNPHTTQYGELKFSCEDGGIYFIYIEVESIDLDPSCGTQSRAYLNTNYPNNTMVLKKCEYRTLNDIYPGGYDEYCWATKDCYYIENGDYLDYLY